MFQFKQFAVHQDRCPMKVGTDGVLLGAWVELLPTDRRMLDIGTGTGVIALMLAQRSAEAQIDGVDIDSVEQASENAAHSPWSSRLRFFQTPIQEFTTAERYDLIVSNPPYFVDALTSPDAGRTQARHAVTLSFGELIASVVRLMAPAGRFAVVLPVTESKLLEQAAEGQLWVTRRTEVRTTPNRPPKRVLLEFATAAQPLRTSELVIGTGTHEQYTAEYQQLTRDFYLKF